MNIRKPRNMRIVAAAFLMIIMTVYGCGDTTPVKTVGKAVPPKAVTPSSPSVETETEAVLQDMAEHEGYIYQQRDRRDPFVPLIVTTAEVVGKAERKIGTLESYDISEFKLSAVAKKGTDYFALLVTPDNRSFTVNKGDVIGLSKGKVNQILSNRVILVEYSKDFRGDLKERQLILEFHKGETK
jgi:Tfp pilus assembly protein PilP